MNSENHAGQAVVRRRLVAVIGDAGVRPGDPKYALAESIGRQLVDSGYRVLTGGLGGVMEAASRGARASAAYQQGDTMGVLPGHDPLAANEFVDIAVPTGLDHVRNSVVAHADAVVAVGGGAGTMSEICLAWIYKRMVVALRVDGWSGRVADSRIDGRVRYPDIKEDRVYGASTSDDVVALLREQLGRYSAQHHGVRRRT